MTTRSQQVSRYILADSSTHSARAGHRRRSTPAGKDTTAKNAFVAAIAPVSKSADEPRTGRDLIDFFRNSPLFGEIELFVRDWKPKPGPLWLSQAVDPEAG